MGPANNNLFNHQEKMDEFYFLFSNPRDLPCFWIIYRLLREASVGCTEDTGGWAGTFISTTGSSPASRPSTWEQGQKEPSLICEKFNNFFVFKLSACKWILPSALQRKFYTCQNYFSKGGWVLLVCLNPFRQYVYYLLYLLIFLLLRKKIEKH